MPELSASDFDNFFQALWEKTPFAWQSQLANRVLKNRDTPWPEAIGLPTGSGKTACIDIAVFALAASAHHLAEGQPLSIPRRIFFTVDRRIIVDDAYQRARYISTRLHEARDGILKEVADRLRRLSGHEDDTSPLGAHVLRGGMYRSEAWAESPTKPAIICTTVDQLGSRLLFRAYGRSFKAWPIHAGLVANDSLILLDEAHCARPLLQTLDAIRQYRTWAKAPLQNPFFVSIMSATPPAGATDIFKDESDEPSDPTHPLGKRQRAPKPANLCDPIEAKGKAEDNKFADALARLAQAHVDDAHQAVVVFCNRVSTARAVHAALSKSKRHMNQTILLTGRMRSIDKDDVVKKKLAELTSEQAERRVLEQPVIVVATQTLEVGADLDFDALVTECASLDALRQRFGRLNRTGRDISAKASIAVRESQSKDSSDDPVYGASLASTWQWLKSIAGDSHEVDFGITALFEKLPAPEVLADLTVLPPLTPVMLPAHVDGWAQTAPRPQPTADISLFLHGVNRSSADVQVCWRGDIELGDKDGEDAALDTLSLAPPCIAECLPVPIGVFRRWMQGQDIVDASSDLEGEIQPPDDEDDQKSTARRAVRWRNRNEMTVIDNTRGLGLRPGDTCILPASLQSSVAFGDIPDESELDIGDRAALETRAKVTLRVHERLLEYWPKTETVHMLQEWLLQANARYEEDPDSLQSELIELLRQIAHELDDATHYSWLKRAGDALAKDKRLRLFPHPAGGFIIRGSRRLKQPTDDSFGDEDDATASGTVNVPLPVHLKGVGAFAERFAEACGLPGRLVNALRLAGELHDLGKADPRFQTMLRNGSWWARGPLLAKSSNVPQSRQRYEAARIAAGYPKGGRHELLSVRLAESAPNLLPDDSLLRDLVLHLVASHHGYCRPFAPVAIDESPIEVSIEFDGEHLTHSSDTQLERVDMGVSERYWRLTRHFGWWGLAWLEAILRLADHRRSEWEQSDKENQQ